MKLLHTMLLTVLSFINDILLLEKWAIIPSKCELLAVTNKTSTLCLTSRINKVPIKALYHAKYLWLTMDLKLAWKEHMYKALAFLCHSLKSCCLYM